MSTIPNVSSVYRDLAHIYTNTGFLGKNNQPISYILDQNQNQRLKNEKTSFQELYSYKQKRHNQLMSRLHSSVQQNKMILGGLQQPIYTNYGYNDYENSNKRQYQTQPYLNSSINTYENAYGAQVQKFGNFIMPKIKYRHIEDEKEKNPNPHKQVISNSPIKLPSNIELQKQFYQDMGTSGKIIFSKGNRSNNLSKQQKYAQKNQQNQVRIQHEQDMRSQISNRTNTFVRSNKNEKYQDKIESYYELCRKNMSIKNIPSQTNKEQKFIRTNNNNKNKAMKLDQAIKLLSLD